MKVEDSLFEELVTRCKQNNVDYESASKDLKKILGSEEPLIYLFGIGIQPENPLVLVDLLILTRDSVFGASIEKTHRSLYRTKRNAYNSIQIIKDNQRIKLLVTSTVLFGGGFYINNLLKYEDQVWQFAEHLHNFNFP